MEFENVHEGLIENYEKLISELTNELNLIKTEHFKIKEEMSVLIEENNSLSIEYRRVLENQEQLKFDCKTIDENLLQNLRTQLEFASNEKDYTKKLWQDAIKTIDGLEEELKLYQAGNYEFVPKKDFLKYEEKLSSLQNKNKAQIMEQSFKNQEGVMKIIKNLEDEILQLQERQHNLIESKKSLEETLNSKEELIKKVQQRNLEYRSKVEEAVQVVEAALTEKDAALLRENKIIEDADQAAKNLENILKEAKKKFDDDLMDVKKEQEEKLQKVFADLKEAQIEIGLKTKEVEKLNARCNLLEHDLERMQKGNLHIDDSNSSKLLILEKNLESTFQKLLLSEKNNIQRTAQIESIKSDMEQMSNHYEHIFKGKEIEKETLNQKIRQILVQLEDSKNKREQNSVVIEEMRVENDKLGQEIKKLNGTIAEINTTNAAILKELQTKLEAQTQLNRKWRSETTVIITNLEKVIFNSKKEVRKLRKANAELLKQLQVCETKIVEYKTFLQLISQDVNKITSLTLVN